MGRAMPDDLRTALRHLNDAAHEALRAALGSPDVYDREIVRRLRIISADTDRMVDETAPNVEGAP